MTFRLSDDRYGLAVAAMVSARMKAGVTQAELAKRLSRHQSYVSKTERKERRADVVEFYDWLRALGLDPLAILAEVAESLDRQSRAGRKS